MISVRNFWEEKRANRLSFVFVLFIASFWGQGSLARSWDVVHPAGEQPATVNEKAPWVDPIVFSDLSEEIFQERQIKPLFNLFEIQPCQSILYDDLKIFFEREKAFDRLWATCLILILFKVLVHCYDGGLSPQNRLSSYVSFESSGGIPVFSCYGDVDPALQQKLSLADIVELLQFLSEDLAKIDALERVDREDILQVLCIRKHYLDRKLKEFGIFRYSPPVAISESMHYLFALGFGLGVSIFVAALTSIDFDADSLFLQVPSKELLVKNLERFSYSNNQVL